ncbi:MAG: hypothetical protein IPL99_21085 [Candidatus Competibacteraceae bacterium]|nr:hypothetical protein [Candidatus Competibacteraceae bacterium]
MIRRGHPFEGRVLRVLRRTHRNGQLHFLLILPDQSRSLIPADWTDWARRTQAPRPLPMGRGRCWGLLSDLLHTRSLLDALLNRPSPFEERRHAKEPALSGKPTAQTGDLGSISTTGNAPWSSASWHN